MKQRKHIAKPFCTLALLGTLPFASAAGIPAKPSMHQLHVNGIRTNITGWLIHGNNYFKLRDIGKLANFNVTWDSEKNAVQIETDTGYIPEPTETGTAQNTVQTEALASPIPQTVYINGRQIKPEGYMINGNNYFKLRDLGELIPFQIEYDNTEQIVNLTTNEKKITSINTKPITTVLPETVRKTWNPVLCEFHNDMVACNWDKAKYVAIAQQYRIPITGNPDSTVQDVIAALETIQNAPVDAVSMDNTPVNLFWADELRKALGESALHRKTKQPEKVTEEMLREWENEMIQLINEERKKVGVPAVTQDKALAGFARHWAKHLTTDFRHSTINDIQDYAAHVGIDSQMLEGSENITGAYNLGMGYHPMREAMKNFMNSPGHRAAILREDNTRAGTGFAISEKGNIYCCQNFGK